MAKTCPRAGETAGVNSILPDAATGSAEPAEERELPAAAEGKLPGRETNRLLPGTGLRALDRDVGEAALVAFEGGDHARVATVEVLPDGELAGFVDKGRLIGEVHRDWRLEADVLLAAADHAGEPLLGITLVRLGDREENLGVFERIFDPHAAVAVGALLLGEQIFVRGIVLIDQELVGEIEADAPERVLLAGRLEDMDRAVAIVFDLEPDPLQRHRLLLERR